MFERRKDPLILRKAFLKRVVRYALLAFAIDAGSLAVGVIGYHVLEGLGWVDLLLNASMLFGGMGPVNELHTPSGKFFFLNL